MASPLGNPPPLDRGSSDNGNHDVEESHGSLQVRQQNPLGLDNQNLQQMPDVGGTCGCLDAISSCVHSLAMRELVPTATAYRFFVGDSGDRMTSSSIGFINQGNTTPLECRGQALHLHTTSMAPIDVVYNGVMSSTDITPNDPRVRLLFESWNDYFFDSQTTAEDIRLQVCAGDAALVLRLALESFSLEFRRRIMVLAIAPSCVIPEELCHSVIHYRTEGDVSLWHSDLVPESSNIYVLPRSPDSRGVIDWAFTSSSFYVFIQAEVACFTLYRRLLHQRTLPADYLIRVQALRDQLLRRARRMAWSCIPIETRDMRLRLRLESFLDSHHETYLISSGINLYEGAQDETFRNILERMTFTSNFARDCFFVAAVISAFYVNGIPFPRIAIGIPILEGASLMRRSGAYLVPRNRVPCFLRQFDLRAGFLNSITWIYEAGVFTIVFRDPGASPFVLWGLGSHLIFSSTILFSHLILQFDNRFRNRVQEAITDVQSGNIIAPRDVNPDAGQVGLLQRLGRAANQVTRGAGVLVVGASFIYPMLISTVNEHATNSTASGNHTDDSGANAIPASQAVLWGITSLFALSSVVSNVIQSIRVYRRLRDRRAEQDRDAIFDPNTMELVPIGEPEGSEGVPVERESNV